MERNISCPEWFRHIQDNTLTSNVPVLPTGKDNLKCVGNFAMSRSVIWVFHGSKSYTFIVYWRETLIVELRILCRQISTINIICIVFSYKISLINPKKDSQDMYNIFISQNSALNKNIIKSLKFVIQTTIAWNIRICLFIFKRSKTIFNIE